MFSIWYDRKLCICELDFKDLDWSQNGYHTKWNHSLTENYGKISISCVDPTGLNHAF